MPWAALFSLLWRGPSHCPLSALRGTSGSVIMTTPGGAGTSLCASATSYVLGAPASIMGRSSHYWAPALRFAPSRCPKPSSAPIPAAGA